MDPKTKIKEQLEMSDGKKRQLNLRKRRVNVNQNSFNLVIGLGGTGLQALIETKGLINLTCEGADKNVAFLAFDTDDDTFKRLTSSESTGSAKLDKDEGVVLDKDGLATIFTLDHIEMFHSDNPEYFKWVDERLTPSNSNTGAGGIRQMGRLILMKNYQTVVKAIEKAANRLSQNAAKSGATNAFLNVYILAGIGGGTGSGSFIDMPLIVRDVLSSIPGFIGKKNTVYGYLFMADVNLAKPGGTGDKIALKRNAYAAFQELDFMMGIHDNKQAVEFDYGKGKTVSAGSSANPIYDYIHLVSTTNAPGNQVGDAYAVSMRAIAQNILSFVADERAIGKVGTAFAITSYYDNINGKITDFTTHNSDKAHRSLKYLAIGSMNYDLPIDDIMMYITSMLFQKMNGFFDEGNMPGDGAFQQALGRIGVPVEAMLGSFKEKLPLLRVNPVDMKKYKSDSPDFRQKAESLYASLNNTTLAEELDKAASDIVVSMCHQFDVLMEECFKDTRRGPVHANRLIVHPNGILKQISTQSEKLSFPKGQIPSQMFAGLVAKYETAKAELKKIKPFANRDADLAAFNKAGIDLVNAYEYYILAERMQKIYSEVHKYITNQNSMLYEFVAGTMTTLKEVFANNANILTKTTEQETAMGRNFHWEAITIPKINDYLKESFSTIFENPNNNLLQNFVDDLWKEALKWMQDSDLYDPRGFVSKYINDKFGDMAEMTIEAVVNQMLGPGQTLEATIKQVLLPKIIQDSAPLFHSIGTLDTGETVMLVSIPEKCPEIYKVIEEELKGKNVILQRSEINNRIYAQTVQCGISLANYQEIWNAERVYAANRSSLGLHLVDPHGDYAPEDPVSWMMLPTLVPNYLRPKTGSDQKVMELIEEEKARKDDLKKNIDLSVPASRHPAIDLTVKGGVWAATFTMTNVKVEREKKKLSILVDGDEQTFDLEQQDLTAAKITLERILSKGFPEVYPKAVKTSFTLNQQQVSGSKPDDVRNNTLEILCEQYIQQIYRVHDFETELNKYALIREFLDTVLQRIDEEKLISRTYLRYSQVYMLERVIRHMTPTGQWQACLVAITPEARKLVPFAELHETQDYMMEYELFRDYCLRLEGKKVSDDEKKSEEQLKKQQGAVQRLIKSATDTFDQAVESSDPVCTEYSSRVKEMLKMVNGYRDAGPVYDTRNGYASLVPDEVVQFYERWKAALDKMLLILKQSEPKQVTRDAYTPPEDSEDSDFDLF